MVEPVNLRQFKKRKKREEKELQADRNRKQHGLSTGLKKQAKLQNIATLKKLDGHKTDPATQE